MTRIVAGTAGGRTLQVPRTGTRPTSDRVREALFSRLEHLGVLDGAEVLDLYAGSGALGLEAASRNAARVTLVESHRPAARLIRRNAEVLGLIATVVPSAVETYLGSDRSRVGDSKAGVTLAFLDPPYDLGEEHLRHVLTLLTGWLADDAVVVVERSRRSPEPAWPAQLTCWDDRRYGETTVWFAEPAWEQSAGGGAG